MRVHQVTCPKCGAGLKSQAGIPVGQTVPCPRCKVRFTVETPDQSDVIDDAEVFEDFDVEEPAPKITGPPPVPPAQKKKPAPRRAADDEDTEDERPAKKRPAGAQATRRRPDDEDAEYDDRPRKKKKGGRRRDEADEGVYQRLKHNVLVRVITLVVLLGILAVLAYLLYAKKRAEREAESAGRSPAAVAIDGSGHIRSA